MLTGETSPPRAWTAADHGSVAVEGPQPCLAVPGEGAGGMAAGVGSLQGTWQTAVSSTRAAPEFGRLILSGSIQLSGLASYCLLRKDPWRKAFLLMFALGLGKEIFEASFQGELYAAC